MRSRLRRPEEAVLVPQHHRVKLRGKRCRLLPKRFKPQRLGRFRGLPLCLIALRGHGGSRRRAYGVGDAGGFRGRSPPSLVGGRWRRFLRSSNRRNGEPPLLPPAYKGGGGRRFAFSRKGSVRDVTRACAVQPRARPPHVTHTSHASPPRRRDKSAPPGEGATGAELRSNTTQATRARALLGPGPTTLGTVCGPGPGAPVGVLK